MTLFEVLQKARSERDFNALVEAIPYARFMGITLENQDGELIGKLSYSDMLIGNTALPALHGGTTGALLESTAIFQTLWEADTVILPKIVTITIDYLRSAKAVDTFAWARVTRRGKTVVTVAVEAWQEDRAQPIARANAHFLIRTVSPGEGVRG